MKIEKKGIIIIFILILMGLNIFFLNKNVVSQKNTSFLSGKRIVKGAVLELKVPQSFPEPQWQGGDEDGSLSLSHLLEQTRYEQYFVIAWSMKALNWQDLLPEPRVLPQGKREEYSFENTRNKDIIIDNHPAKFSIVDFTIIRGCGAKNKNYLFVAELETAKDKKHFAIVSYSEKNKANEFFDILKSLKVYDGTDYQHQGADQKIRQ